MNLSNTLFVLFCVFTGIFTGTSQEETTEKKLTVDFYLDTYYANVPNGSHDGFRSFTTTSNRNNQIGLNIAQLGAQYESKDVRASLTLHYGDIAKATWSDDFNEVQTATVGLRLFKTLWLDAGFFTTHIGTESFLPKNNWTASTAVATFNEPFYQAGAKLSNQFNENWYAELWVLNGYNQFVDENDELSVGALLTYAFNDRTSITYTNIFGQEATLDDPVSRYRTYHNAYLNTQFSERWWLTAGFDIGSQTNSELETGKTAWMYNALLTAKFQQNNKWSYTSRIELFKDQNGFISGIVPSQLTVDEGLSVYGITLSTEYKPTEYSFLRFEARRLASTNDAQIFEQNTSTSRYEFIINLGIVWDRSWLF
ncbi:hypothetical protein AAT17_02330 [Nonlabens sp. MIC269]|uniref:outer membrane beta-barrel protein n=1 Tax=Nonlabens sp. MIC269 TaxID=1476901 RepID=UPI0007205548|nr:outer membrane beta-barrel protein [Nonlabens sp. MIC269]ALM20166.1 hypothetical protein AAT17_02330 [Nonlabens sp. MIC269]